MLALAFLLVAEIFFILAAFGKLVPAITGIAAGLAFATAAWIVTLWP